ncbi:MAG: ABC transporter permease [Dehalococcoidia bacterium]|nr:ABC transporter permease [Dehalococcoidia bacterium]
MRTRGIPAVLKDAFLGNIGALEGIALILFVIIAWELTVDLGLIDPWFLSPPRAVAALVVRMFLVTGEVYPDILVSLQEGSLGFAIAVAIGIPLGIVMGRIDHAKNMMEPVVMALYATPTVALLPLFALWLGFGLWSKVIIVFLGGVFAVIVNTQAGVESADPHVVEAARSFTATEGQIWRKIVLPSAVPFIIAGLRLAIGRVLISVVVAEMFGASAGVGYMIVSGGSLFQADKVFLGTAIFSVAGILTSQALAIAEKRLAPWLSIRTEV